MMYTICLLMYVFVCDIFCLFVSCVCLTGFCWVLLGYQGSDLGAQTNGLLVHRLPCAEDVRDYNFPSLVTFAGANRYISE